LAGVERAATTVVRGAPEQFADAYGALHEWIDRTGDRATSFERELNIDCDGPRDTWVTELQTILATDTDRMARPVSDARTVIAGIGVDGLAEA
jgi:hypothetical protein